MTTLTRFVPFRSPLADVAVLQNRLNAIFSDFARPEGEQETLAMGNFIPPVDIYEDAQQLVLKLEVPGIKQEDLKDRTLYKPRGCDNCSGTGFRGRKGIFELMVMNSEIRNLAFERSPSNKLRKAAVAGGMRTLIMDGRSKVLNGLTTAEEIVKVAQVEGVVQTT